MVKHYKDRLKQEALGKVVKGVKKVGKAFEAGKATAGIITVMKEGHEAITTAVDGANNTRDAYFQKFLDAVNKETSGKEAISLRQLHFAMGTYAEKFIDVDNVDIIFDVKSETITVKPVDSKNDDKKMKFIIEKDGDLDR